MESQGLKTVVQGQKTQIQDLKAVVQGQKVQIQALKTVVQGQRVQIEVQDLVRHLTPVLRETRDSRLEVIDLFLDLVRDLVARDLI
ncbi:hypothetical protein C8Q76DRAFT_736609 [Earliella scabrosa]|nr:hypothetical protein C8Q76DRAFT_736609 [Earliella scabrosa]